MRYQVKDPQGQTHIIDGPEGASQSEIIAQAQKLIPQKPDWRGVVGSAMKEATFQPGTRSLKMTYDPVTQARALPPLVQGMTTVMSGMPMGVPTMATEGARGLSDLALKTYGRSDLIPSLGQHALEAGGALAGDVLGGMAKASKYAKDIGAAESKMNLGNVRKLAPASNPRTAIKLANQINDMGELTPQEAKAMQAPMKTIWNSGWIHSKGYSDYLPDIVKATQKVQRGLNQVPGRALPAKEMATLYSLVNRARKPFSYVWSQLPKLAARGARWGIIGVP